MTENASPSAAVLAVLSSRPGEYLPHDEVAEAAGIEDKNLVSQVLSALKSEIEQGRIPVAIVTQAKQASISVRIEIEKSLHKLTHTELQKVALAIERMIAARSK